MKTGLEPSWSTRELLLAVDRSVEGVGRTSLLCQVKDVIAIVEPVLGEDQIDTGGMVLRYVRTALRVCGVGTRNFGTISLPR